MSVRTTFHHGAESEGLCIICVKNALPGYWGIPWCDKCLDRNLEEQRIERTNRRRMKQVRR